MAYNYGEYTAVVEQRKRAERDIKKLRRIGFLPSPIAPFKGKIAGSFWGKEWCKRVEEYEDMDYRAERGRRYVRAGCVCHLEIEPNRITAFVSGSELYFVEIGIAGIDKNRWQEICRKCSWEIGSVADLLDGHISNTAIAVLTDPETGILPNVNEISFACSCPDWSDMCKHAAAALYAVGKQLDDQPELLFKMRGVDPYDLVQMNIKIPDNINTIAKTNIKDIFGIELELPPVTPQIQPVAALPVITNQQPDIKAAPDNLQTNKTETNKNVAEKQTAGKKNKAASHKAVTRKVPTKAIVHAKKSPRPVLKIFNPQHPTGKSIRALRIHAMLSLEGMARELGVSVGTITRWEGAPTPVLKADSIQKLEKFQTRHMAEIAQ